jgi:molybdopterin molybdotransferase
LAAEPQDRCAEPRALTLDQALELILAPLAPVSGGERLPLKQAAGRVLAEDIASPLDLPPFANSAMDGYACRAGDPGLPSLRLIGTAWAGRRFAGSVGAGECVRIFTGAALPDAADTVVMQENAEREGETVRFAAEPRPGDNVRPRGGELRAGQPLLAAGKRLGAADIGLLAAVGLAEVPVKRRLRVAILSTGDELRPLGQALAPGEIHDSNRYALDALLAELGAECLDFGAVRDDPGALRAVLLEASRQADAVISTGGASVGDADFVVDILRELGQVEFWKVAVKPGKPFAYGRIGQALWFGLPGNPVAVIVTFRQLVRPALLRLMGAPASPALRLPAVCDRPLRKAPGRMEFQRGVYRRADSGEFVVSGLAGQGSDRLSSVSQANCYIVLSLESAGVAAGDRVEIEPFDGPA